MNFGADLVLKADIQMDINEAEGHNNPYCIFIDIIPDTLEVYNYIYPNDYIMSILLIMQYFQIFLYL